MAAAGIKVLQLFQQGSGTEQVQATTVQTLRCRYNVHSLKAAACS
jgi:hypothetical protein